MATLYESYTTGWTTTISIYDIVWPAQTFTPSIAHKITSVKLQLYRIGSPGTLTVSIRATDGSGHPTGEDLCSGTTDGDTLPTFQPFEWREITLGAGYNLDADTKYAIVARAPDGIEFDEVLWLRDPVEPTYVGGCWELSINSGSSWTSYTDDDLMFEDWGEPLGWSGKVSGVTNPAKVMGVDVANIAKVKGVASA